MIRLSTRPLLLGVFLAATLWSPMAVADEPSFELTIRNHRFEPETITIPAKKRVKLVIHNADATPEEFESHELNREKVIPGNSKATVFVGPLEPGAYPFVGEFHESTAKGKIVVK